MSRVEVAYLQLCSDLQREVDRLRDALAGCREPGTPLEDLRTKRGDPPVEHVLTHDEIAERWLVERGFEHGMRGAPCLIVAVSDRMMPWSSQLDRLNTVKTAVERETAGGEPVFSVEVRT